MILCDTYSQHVMEVRHETRIVHGDIREVHLVHRGYLPANTPQDETYAAAAGTRSFNIDIMHYFWKLMAYSNRA